jgi:hypothetical protein
VTPSAPWLQQWTRSLLQTNQTINGTTTPPPPVAAPPPPSPAMEPPTPVGPAPSPGRLPPSVIDTLDARDLGLSDGQIMAIAISLSVFGAVVILGTGFFCWQRYKRGTRRAAHQPLHDSATSRPHGLPALDEWRDLTQPYEPKPAGHVTVITHTMSGSSAHKITVGQSSSTYA